MTSDIDQAFRLLVEENPRAAAERMLVYLVAAHRARGSALLARVDGELRVWPLVRMEALPLSRLAGLHEILGRDARNLAGGHVALGADYALVPLVDDGELVGAVYLDAPEDTDVRVRSPFIVALTKAVVAWRGRPTLLVSDLPETPIAMHHQRRDEMLTLLNRNEWNIARVARIMGTTRRTVYMRMRRYEIPRERVPKMLKPVDVAR